MIEPEPNETIVPSQEDLCNICEMLEQDRENEDYTGIDLNSVNLNKLLGIEVKEI